MDPHLLTTTQAVDPVFMLIFGISLVLLIGITATMIWFAYRYHRSRAPEPTSEACGNLWLEIVWTVLPTILVLMMFYYGWTGYLSLRDVPKDAMPVTAIARQWSWTFSYPNGKTSAKLFVPVGKAIRVDLVSEDVLHGFYLPAFRVKRDVVPGMKNHVWFVADKAGSYDLFCSQFCGVDHSAMTTTVEAIPEAKFKAWLREREGGEHPGEELLEKHGCLGCHSLDGSAKVGPTFKGIWGREVTVLTNGVERTVTVDEAYLRRSILDPKAEVVKGFPPIMPAFADRLKPEEITTIIGALRTAGSQGPPQVDGAKLAKVKGCLACHTTDGSPGIGPTFKGLYQSRITVRQDGATIQVEVDDAYLRESIRLPAAKVVDGFQAIMPPFPDLTDQELAALVEFIEGLR